MHSKRKSGKRFLSGILSATVLANFCTVMPVTAFADDDNASGTQKTGSNGHRYQLFDSSMSWDEAKEYCESLGGHLATVTSAEEQEIIESLLANGTRNSYWLGAKLDEERSWKWLNGEEFSYGNWASGQPDNFCGVENALMVYREKNPRGSSGFGKWNDLCEDGTCNNESFFGKENFGFICEWDSTEEQTAEWNGHKYQIFDRSIHWKDAKAYCESIGGHLATLTDEEEKTFVEDFAYKKGKKEIYWLGGTDEVVEGDWQWVTGEDPSMMKEHGTFDNMGGEENYLALTSRSSWYWNDWGESANEGNPIGLYSYENVGFICEWDSEPIVVEDTMKHYALFSASNTTDFSFSGWKSTINGNVYTGSSFQYSGSELYITGSVDAVGSVITNGWKMEIDERNENVEALNTTDYDSIIHDNAQPYDYYDKSVSYIEDLNVVDKSIKVAGDVVISGTTFEGDCYIIAEGDITYNVNALNTNGRVFLYSRNGNITINGTTITIDGGMYAPNGNISFNTYKTELNGFAWADSITYSGTIFNVNGANFDLLKPKCAVKTYTIDEDFKEGKFNGLGIAVADELTLDAASGESSPSEESVFGDVENGKGVKVTCSTDKTALSGKGDKVTVKYGLSGFGEADVAENAVDLIIVVDESGSMSGSRMTNTKTAAKEIISQMKANDRCAIVGFANSANTKLDLTSNKENLGKAVDTLRASGGTAIYTGINKALDMFEKQSNDERQKYIILLSDGEDGSSARSLEAATKAKENNVRIFSMKVGSGTLQMQNIAINSNGIYKNAPTADDIVKIMSYFASEVFNVAGRSTTFKTVIKDASSVDVSAITPAPSKVTENEDGSASVEWNIDRITIDEKKEINIPMTVTSDSDGFADLLENTSCVYYDRSGKPNVVYADDISLPISGYAEKGNWTAVFDSERDNAEWENIYWNGKRCGDGTVSVYVSASDDGENFSEPVKVENHKSFTGVKGRYAKISVDMTVSSDGKTPELYDITIVSKDAPVAEMKNAAPTVSIRSKDKTKVNVPMRMRAVIADDCLGAGITVNWSCADEKVKIADPAKLFTSVICSETGSYDITCTVSDGIETVTSVKTIVCEPADSYADIDPEHQDEAVAPKISVALPEYADKKQQIKAKIERLNDTEISWYSVIFNNNTAVDVTDDGEFTLTMPNSNGKYPVVVRAFDWSGKSDVKEYTITVDSTAASVSIVPSSADVISGDEAYFKVSVAGAHKIKELAYTLNGKAVTIPEDGILKVDTTSEKEFVLAAAGLTTAGKELKASAKITVIEADKEKPVVKVSFDKSSYNEKQNAVVTVTAADNVGVKTLTVLLNGKEIKLDSNGKYTISNLKYGTEYIITANASDAAGNIGTATGKINAKDVTKPELTLQADKTNIKVGEKVNLTVKAADNNGTVTTKLFAGKDELTVSEDGTAVFAPEKAGSYDIKATAADPSGNKTEKKITIKVVEPDTVAPAVDLTFDKDTYFELDDVTVTVKASDNVGVVKTVLFIDDKEVKLSADGTYVISKAQLKEYKVEAKAYDAENNEGIASAALKINEAKAPEISASFDKDTYVEGDSLSGLVTAQGQSEIITLTATVNEKPLAIEEGIFSLDDLKAGEYVFSFTAEDSRGKTSNIKKTVTVLKKEQEADESLYADIKKNVKYGESAVYTVFAADDIDKSTISVTLDGKKITLAKDYTYEFKGDKLFDHEFVLTAKTKKGDVLTFKNTVTVYETDKPILSVKLSKDQGILEHEDIVATIKAEDISGIKKTMCLFDGVEMPIDKDGHVYLNDFVMKPHEMIVKTWDNFGNYSGYKIIFYIVEYEVSGGNAISVSGGDDVDSKLLNAEIAMPTNESVISCPTDIIGKASGTEFERYRLDYQSAAGGDYTVIREGDKPVNAQVLGEFDPTMLRNGLYNIRLTVWGKNGEAVQSEVLVSVEGQMKLGNFSINFQDMDINAAGLPVTIIRGYDSRDRNVSGDFGYGWNISTCSATITKSCNLSEGWIKSGTSSATYSAPKPHIVSINWGNGKVEKFAMKVTSNGWASHSPTSISYESMDKSGSKLKSSYDGYEWLFDGGYLCMLDGDWNEVYYEPKNFVLTRPDGSEYTLSTERGVTKYKDANGNTLIFYTNAIAANGDSNSAIVYNFDSSKRITSIVSPTGKKVSYEYDENGDLVKVTDISGNETKFEYDNHYLTAIIDPRGVTVSRNIYDDNGRLIKTIDADGNEIVYEHNIDAREETVTDRNGGVTRYTYDHQGNILSQTDPMGNTVKNTYDSNGNLATKTDAMGNVTKYSYDDSGNMKQLEDAEGNVVINEYDAKGLITSINAMGIDIMKVSYDDKGNTAYTEDALGNKINYSYDSKGNLKSVTDEIGTYMNMTYDSNGNVISTTNGAGSTAEFTYDKNGNCLSKTLKYTSDGVVRTVTENYSYDDAGNLTKIIDSDGNITSTEYNSIGKVAVATDEEGRQTTYDYDDFGNLIKITYADGTSESFTYDREGNNLTATDRLGRIVTMKYDKVGNLISKTYPNGAVVTYSYDKNYNLVSTVNASGNKTEYEYDSIGRNTAIIDALDNRTEFSYNSHSQLESMKDAKGNIYTYTYDDNGNRISTVYPDGSSVSTAYDARGRVTSVTDQYGNTTSYAYDGADRLVSVTDALDNTTSYTYNEVGNLIKVTDANDHSTIYSYDDFSRVIKTTNALGQTAEVTYDKCGNILTSTDFGGKLTTYTYDEFDRLASKETADGTVTYAYTADGKLSAVTDETGTTKYFYNGMDGLSKVEYPNGSFVSYSYDDASRLTSVKTAYGTTSYEYDKLDRLVRVVDRNGYATLYEYDKNGNRSAVRYANGIVVSYKYDEVNRLISEKALDKQGGLVAQYEYTLGEAGERTSVKELDRTVEYTYDALYRLTGEKITAGDIVTEYTYAYDNVSNRILKTENGVKTTYTYNELNQLTAENSTEYKYDEAGNLISVTSAEKSALYAYNAENKMIRATVQEGNKVSVEEYEYDYAGNRISKTTNVNGVSETIKYLNDNSVLTNVLAEINEFSTAVCYYTVGADLISQERDGILSVYLYDGHGSVRGLIDSTGKITDTYNYDAFGNLLNQTGSTVNNYLYCGEQFDSATGLYYLRARYMNPATGTFITQDTYAGTVFDPTSLHKYLYANANPVMNVDPSGYFTLADVSISSTISNTIDTIQNDAFALAVWRSFKAGFISAGVDVYRQLRTTGTINWGEVFETFFVSTGLGIVFGGSAILAASLKSAAIYTALGASCFTFFGISLAQAQADGEAGFYDLMFLDFVFSALSLKGAKGNFDNAFETATAKNTAGSTTNTSTSNTNTAQNSNESSNANNSKRVYRGDRSSVKPEDVFEKGFTPKGTHDDPLLHTKSNATAGNFVSTSSDLSVAQSFAGKHGYVYVIETNNYVDINSVYGDAAYYPEQFECSVYGGISPSEVVGAYPMDNGTISGPLIRNPNYGGK